MHYLEIGQMQTYKINALIIPYHNTGAHFIDWSLYYVCNQDTYLVTDIEKSLNKQPDINSTNWHAHKSYTARGSAAFKTAVESIQKKSSTKFVNLYATVLPDHLALDMLFHTTFQNASKDQIIKTREFVINDTKEIFSYCQHFNIPFVFVDYQDNDLLNIVYNNRQIIDWNHKLYSSVDELHLQFQETFYNTTKDSFSSENIWDKREQLALLLHHQIPEKQNYRSMYDLSLPHLYYTTDDIWNGFPTILPEMCDFFNLPIRHDNLKSLEDYWHSWRNNHKQYFSRHFDEIINNIVNGNYMSLKRFKLDFIQETLIQNALITKHNLNLKTWQLEKFPDNTIDLHKLLEPNIHTL